MSPSKVGTGPPRGLLVPQLIVGAMLLGLVTFGLVVGLFVDRAKVEGGVLLPIALLFFIGCAIVGWILPRAWADRLRRTPAVEARTRERGGFLPTFLTITVIRAALMEASGFLFLIAYMVEGNRLALFLAALAALHLAAIFPSRGAYDRFLAALEDSGSRPR